ncbi:MAG: hypothetical protein ABWY63_00435 [Hyphomicrobiaceae bacterium]
MIQIEKFALNHAANAGEFLDHHTAIAAQNRRATSSEDREHSGLQRYKACQFTRRMIIAPYVRCLGEEVIPSRGEIAAAPATIGQKPVIARWSWLQRHTPRG